jgi:hypothetical protein
MRLKNITPENEENLVGASSQKVLNMQNLPPALTAELSRFADRNCLVAIENSYEAVCERCLKAHALRTAKAMNLSAEVLESIKELFGDVIGHNGYYQDQEKIVKIKR